MALQHDHTPVNGSRDEWRAARLDLLQREKELTRLRDELAAERRRLPWVRLEKHFEFDGPSGRVPMRDLFDGDSHVIVYHFMLGPGWGEGGPLFSVWSGRLKAIP